jgi:exosortase/archaeosortase family protein
MEPSANLAITASPETKLSIGGTPAWLRFALICTMLILAALWLDPLATPLCRVTAAQVGTLLGLFGLAPHVQGDLVLLPGFSVRIVTECTPLYACLLYASFVLAQPSHWRRTLAGLFTGVLVIAAFNLLRISFITAVGPHVSTLLFDILHVYLGQVAMLILVVASAMIWQRWSVNAPSPFPFLLRSACIATVLFVIWVVLNRSYVAILDKLVATMFSLLNPGSQLLTPRPFAVYNHTFAVPLFLALVLAGRNSWTINRFAATVGGVYCIAAWHILFRITHVIWTALGVTAIVPFHQGIYLLGQFLLPFLLWLWLDGGFNPQTRNNHSNAEVQ